MIHKSSREISGWGKFTHLGVQRHARQSHGFSRHPADALQRKDGIRGIAVSLVLEDRCQYTTAGSECHVGDLSSNCETYYEPLPIEVLDVFVRRSCHVGITDAR